MTDVLFDFSWSITGPHQGSVSVPLCFSPGLSAAPRISHAYPSPSSAANANAKPIPYRCSSGSTSFTPILRALVSYSMTISIIHNQLKRSSGGAEATYGPIG